MVEMHDSAEGVPEQQVEGFDRASLVWDEESVVAHQVEVSAKAFAENTFDGSGDLRVAIYASVTNLSDAPERRYLAIAVEALDSQGQCNDEWKFALRHPIGGSSRRKATADMYFIIDARRLEQFTTLRASVIPGGPHMDRLPRPVPIQAHKTAFKEKGIRITHISAKARGVEWMSGNVTTIVGVAFRALVEPDAVRSVRITALDADGFPLTAAATRPLCDEDPESPGTYVFSADVFLPTVPARVIITPDDIFTKVLPDIPDELFELDLGD